MPTPPPARSFACSIAAVVPLVAGAVFLAGGTGWASGGWLLAIVLVSTAGASLSVLAARRSPSFPAAAAALWSLLPWPFAFSVPHPGVHYATGAFADAPARSLAAAGCAACIAACTALARAVAMRSTRSVTRVGAWSFVVVAAGGVAAVLLGADVAVVLAFTVPAALAGLALDDADLAGAGLVLAASLAAAATVRATTGDAAGAGLVVAGAVVLAVRLRAATSLRSAATIALLGAVPAAAHAATFEDTLALAQSSTRPWSLIAGFRPLALDGGEVTTQRPELYATARGAVVDDFNATVAHPEDHPGRVLVDERATMKSLESTLQTHDGVMLIGIGGAEGALLALFAAVVEPGDDLRHGDEVWSDLDAHPAFAADPSDPLRLVVYARRDTFVADVAAAMVAAEQRGETVALIRDLDAPVPAVPTSSR